MWSERTMMMISASENRAVGLPRHFWKHNGRPPQITERCIRKSGIPLVDHRCGQVPLPECCGRASPECRAPPQKAAGVLGRSTLCLMLPQVGYMARRGRLISSLHIPHLGSFERVTSPKSTLLLVSLSTTPLFHTLLLCLAQPPFSTLSHPKESSTLERLLCPA
jgi:hypothetical protein